MSSCVRFRLLTDYSPWTVDVNESCWKCSSHKGSGSWRRKWGRGRVAFLKWSEIPDGTRDSLFHSRSLTSHFTLTFHSPSSFFTSDLLIGVGRWLCPWSLSSSSIRSSQSIDMNALDVEQSAPLRRRPVRAAGSENGNESTASHIPMGPPGLPARHPLNIFKRTAIIGGTLYAMHGACVIILLQLLTDRWPKFVYFFAFCE